MLLNRGARNGGGAVEPALEVLAAAGIALTHHSCTPGEDAATVIREHAGRGEIDAVILGGGDGTMNAAAPALRDTGLPFGILPLGTANDLARSLAIEPDLAAAAAVIAAGRLRPLDLGEVNGHLYFNVASIGFSAALAAELGAGAKRRWGRLGYGFAAFGLLRRARPFSAWLDRDGRTERVRTIQVSVGNGRQHGGGIRVAAGARPDDGLLHVYSLEFDHWWQMLAVLPWLRQGTQGNWQDVRSFPCTEITLRTRRPRPVNADGELVTETPAHFRVVPQAVRVFAPPAGEE
jgi:YegS/Rv2252/BmrU family lipid kinase